MVYQRGASPPAKRPWEDAPVTEFRLFRDPENMAKAYHSLLSNIRRTVIHQSALENGGDAEFFRYGPLPVADGEPENFIHAIPVLPSSGYLVVELHPPTDLEGDHVPVSKGPVKLLFQMNDMYLVGFECKKVWYVFSDANLEGISNEVERLFIRRLSFAGSYGSISQNFNNLVIGFNGQLETWIQLTVFDPDGNNNLLLKALCRKVATVSEAIRFPFLAKHITVMFSLFQYDGTVDNEEYGRYNNFAAHFTNWSLYCKSIRKGKDEFTSKNTISTYEYLLTFVGVLPQPSYRMTSSPKKVTDPSTNGDDDVKKGKEEYTENKGDHKKDDVSAKGPFWFYKAPMREYSYRRCAICEHLAYTFNYTGKDAFHLSVQAEVWSTFGMVQEISAGSRFRNLVRSDGLVTSCIVCNSYYSKSAQKDAFNLRIQVLLFHVLLINKTYSEWLGAFGKAKQICAQLTAARVLHFEWCKPSNAICSFKSQILLSNKHEGSYLRSLSGNVDFACYCLPARMTAGGILVGVNA